MKYLIHEIHQSSPVIPLKLSFSYRLYSIYKYKLVERQFICWKTSKKYKIILNKYKDVTRWNCL